MCIVSNVFDYGHQMWPQYPNPPQPNLIFKEVPKVPTPEEWAAFLELVEKARKFDEITNQPDCEDPEKGEWMAEVERRLAALEGESNE